MDVVGGAVDLVEDDVVLGETAAVEDVEDGLHPAGLRTELGALRWLSVNFRAKCPRSDLRRPKLGVARSRVGQG